MWNVESKHSEVTSVPHSTLAAHTYMKSIISFDFQTIARRGTIIFFVLQLHTSWRDTYSTWYQGTVRSNLLYHTVDWCRCKTQYVCTLYIHTVLFTIGSIPAKFQKRRPKVKSRRSLPTLLERDSLAREKSLQ
jgi:hypothetical protein